MTAPRAYTKDSLKTRLGIWHEQRRTPALDWIQVEVTSRCNASCLYCPRTVYRSSWIERDLSLGTFRRLLPALRKTKIVHLQGWGEPLVNRDFFEMVALAKRAGCRVSTTSNGMLLDDPGIERIVSTGVDVIAFSLAGADERNDVIRRGTSIHKVLETISKLQLAKKEHRADTPFINIAYMLLRSDLHRIEAIVPLLGDLGIHQIVISTLDFLPGKDLESEEFMPGSEEEFQELRTVLDRVVREGERCGVSVHYRLANPERRGLTCTENPHRALFVSAEGMISPCVFTNIPVPGTHYVSQGQQCEYRHLIFGNICDNSLSAIWQKKEYASFRDSFYTGTHEPFCKSCPKLYE